MIEIFETQPEGETTFNIDMTYAKYVFLFGVMNRAFVWTSVGVCGTGTVRWMLVRLCLGHLHLHLVILADNRSVSEWETEREIILIMWIFSEPQTNLVQVS